MKLLRTIFLIMLMMFLLVGCARINFKEYTPDEYIKMEASLKSYYGSTHEEIITEFGAPDWVKLRNESTYLLYKWKRSDKRIEIIGPIPRAPYFDTYKVDRLCLLLIFDEKGNLIKHDARTTSDRYVDAFGVFKRDCMDLYSFYISESEWGLRKEIGAHCPNADLGHADAQKRVGDIYYFGAYGIRKNYKKAYVWYSLSVKGGNKSAGEQLMLIRQKLSPSHINEAQGLLDAWLPGDCQTDLLKAVENLH